MHILTNLREIFTEYLNDNQFNQNPKELYEPNNYFLSIGGKRMRPVLVLLGTHLYRNNIEDSLPAAMAIEYFHNFSLIHDDIMDNAPLRRGETTVHEKYGPNTAVLSGDVLLVYAYKYLSKVPEENLKLILNIFSDTAIEVCEGQQLDMNFETQSIVKEEEYIWMIRQKTSVVLAAGLQIGAIIGGASLQDSEALYQYALNLGIAFQIQDDILDCYGKTELVGKQIGGDIFQNKKTILLIRALEASKNANDTALGNILSLKNPTPKEKVQQVLAKYHEYKILDSVKETQQLYIQKAKEHLESTCLPTKNKEILYELIQYLIQREY